MESVKDLMDKIVEELEKTGDPRSARATEGVLAALYGAVLSGNTLPLLCHLVPFAKDQACSLEREVEQEKLPC